MEEKKKTGLTVLRAALGYSVQAFAEELGVSRGTVWKWERDLPAFTNHRICLKYGIIPEIDLQKELTHEEEELIYSRVEEYLVNSGQRNKRTYVRKRTFFGAVAINSSDYVSEIDRVLAEVKELFLHDGTTEDARIRIMVEALGLKMDEWRSNRKLQ